MKNTNEMPSELNKWSWGAFSFNIFWGIGNKVYWPFLLLIPAFNIFWIFVCGFKGNRWLWDTNKYQDVESFKAAQESWDRAGFILFIFAIVVFVIAVPVIIIIAANIISEVFGDNSFFVKIFGDIF